MVLKFLRATYRSSVVELVMAAMVARNAASFSILSAFGAQQAL
jgi:hypothetical protein